MVVAKLTTPFISIRAKKSILKSKACITNQYLPVSSSQITSEVRKTIRASWGERRDSRPPKKRRLKSSRRRRSLRGAKRPVIRTTSRSAGAGGIAAGKEKQHGPQENQAAP